MWANTFASIDLSYYGLYNSSNTFSLFFDAFFVGGGSSALSPYILTAINPT